MGLHISKINLSLSYLLKEYIHQTSLRVLKQNLILEFVAKEKEFGFFSLDASIDVDIMQRPSRCLSCHKLISSENPCAKSEARSHLFSELVQVLQCLW